MPLIHVTLVERRSPQQLRAFAQALTAAATAHLSVTAASVRVIIGEVPATHFFVAGRSKDDQHGASS